jgi:hypothetical protein
MKKFIVFLFVIFVCTMSLNAQQKSDSSAALKKADSIAKDSKRIKISTGVIFLPCASVSLYSFKKMFSPVKSDVPLYFLVSVKKGKASLNPYFMASKSFASITAYNNFYGMFAEYSIKPWATLFVVGTKDISTVDISVGTGVFISVPERKGMSLLLEVKTPTKEWNPSLVVGIMITGIFPIIK